ncbi:MAG: prenyltransferase [Pseudobdellovibrionaceae bacterium]
MTELITLSKGDPRFPAYIEGTFSKDHRALPLQSLNVNTSSEQVTFQILLKAQIQPPFLGLHWLQVLKVKNLLMVAFPIFLVFLKNWQAGTLFDPVSSGLGAMGALFLMTAVNLRNDYLDHLSGLDRLHPQSGSHAIQKGWVTASQVRQWSFLYLALGILFGLPALIRYPQILVLVGVFTLLGIFGMTSFKTGLKYRRWSEWTVFLLLGPLLTIGMQFSMGAPFDSSVLLLGALTGWLSMFHLHLKNFEQLMINDQARFQNTVTWLGFEKSKSWLIFCWLVLVAGLGVLHFQVAEFRGGLLVFAVGLVVSGLFIRALLALQSPVGSQMKIVVNIGQKGILALMTVWTFELLWLAWISG